MLGGFTSDFIAASLIAALPALINICLAAYVFFSMPRRRVTDLFSLVLLASASWQLSAALMRLSADLETAFIFDNVFSPSGLLTAPLIVHFAFLFANTKRKSFQRWFIPMCYISTFFIAVLYPTLNTKGNYILDTYWGWINTRQTGIYSIILGALLQMQYFVAIGILFFSLARTKRNTERFSQLLLITIPFVVVILQALITEAILPFALQINPIPITATTMVLFSIATFIALRGFRLFGGINSIQRDELLNSISDIVIVADEKLLISYVNPVGLRFIGHSLSEVEGSPLTSILKAAADVPEETFLENRLSGVMNGDNIDNLKCRLVSKDSQSIPVLVRADTLFSRKEREGILLVCRNIADLEFFQEEVGRSTRRFKKIIDRSKDAIVIVNEKGIISYAAPSVYNVLGYEQDEMERRHFTEFIHPESNEKAMSVFHENLTSSSPSPEERLYKAIHKNGHILWVEVSAMSLLDDADVNGIVTVFRDVTERRSNELEKEKSLALFESLIHNVSNAMLVEDVNRKLTTVNQKFCEFFSIPVTPAAMIGADCPKAAKEVSHLMRDPETFAQRIEQIIQEGLPVVNEIVAFANGRICERDYFPVRAEDGRFLGHLWRYVDVTQRLKIKEELIEKNHFLALTQEIGNMGSWISTLEENGDTWWSDETLAIYGLTREEFEGKRSVYFEAIHPDDIEIVQRNSGPGIASHKPFDVEHRIILKDGSIKWVYNRMIAEYDGDKPVRLVGITQDITDRKKTEEEIMAQNQELVKINAELDKFVYSASHDIRSPLTSILGLVNVATDEIGDPGAMLYFEMIRDRVIKLDSFTLDIIHYSKNARTELLKEEIHLKELMEETVESLRYQEEAKHIDFEVQTDPGLFINSDRARLSVVLSNLVSNAIKYRRKDTAPYVKISAKKENGTVEFAVEDNGQGIAAEKIDRIFDMFTRFSTQSTGSGLGLYIVKEIVEKLHGSIRVESSPGSGSIFRVAVPDKKEGSEKGHSIYKGTEARKTT